MLIVSTPEPLGSKEKEASERAGGRVFQKREWSASTRSSKIRALRPSLPCDYDQRLLSQPRGFLVSWP